MILFLPFNTFWHEFHCVWHLKITIVVQLPSRCLTLWTPWTAARQASLSLTISQSLPKFMSIESVMHPTISSSVALFCLLSFPASASFPVSWLFTSGGQSFGVSASVSVLPKSIQGWFPLRWTGLILISKDSQESSPAPQFESINSSALWHLYCPALTSAHDYWKNHSFNYMDLCWQSDVFAF